MSFMYVVFDAQVQDDIEVEDSRCWLIPHELLIEESREDILEQLGIHTVDIFGTERVTEVPSFAIPMDPEIAIFGCYGGDTLARDPRPHAKKFSPDQYAEICELIRMPKDKIERWLLSARQAQGKAINARIAAVA